MSNEIAARFLTDDVLIPILIFGGIIVVSALRCVATVVKSVSRERTRREIAAFIAEGSMSPEQGERLMHHRWEGSLRRSTMLVPTLAFGSVEEIGVMIPVIAIVGGLGCAIVGIICKTIRKSVEVRHREESRREIAAYVAEGTMSPEDAYKILSAGTPEQSKRGCC